MTAVVPALRGRVRVRVRLGLGLEF